MTMNKGALDKMQARISEIFSSVQGEGIHCGERHIFVRFSGCNLKCVYCDTKKNRNFEYGKLYTIKKLVKEIKKLKLPFTKNNTIVFTGGEPLIHAEFIKNISKILKKEKFKLYLETNGTLPIELLKIINYMDIVSCDFKLKNYLDKDMWIEQKKFFDILKKSGKEYFVKIVFDKKLKEKDLKNVFYKIKFMKINCPIILQPVTGGKIWSGNIEKFQKMGLKYFSNVLVIPQMHKLLGVR
jgi:7-carboxy-7-deazaguanine synthase